MLYTVQPWSIRIGSMPLQVLLVWGLFIWLLATRSRSFMHVCAAFGPFMMTMIAVLILSILYRTIVDGGEYKRFYQLLTGIAIATISALLINDRKNRKYFFYPLLLAATMSAVVAILQSMGRMDITWSRTAYYLSPVKTPSGLEYYPVAFAYSIVPVAVLSLAAGIHDLRNRKAAVGFAHPLVMIACALILGLGIYVSESRSGSLGIVLGFLASIYLVKKSRRKYIGYAVILGAAALSVLVFVLVVLATNLGIKSHFADKLENTLNDQRVTGTWSIFLPVIIERPMGILADERNVNKIEVKIGSRKTVKEAIMENSGYDPHNFVLTTMFFYGIPAGLSLLFVYLTVIYRGMRAGRELLIHTENQDQEALLLLFLVAANVSLIVHGWYHNANLAMGEMRGWFWVGSVMGLAYFRNRSLPRRAG